MSARLCALSRWSGPRFPLGPQGACEVRTPSLSLAYPCRALSCFSEAGVPPVDVAGHGPWGAILGEGPSIESSTGTGGAQGGGAGCLCTWGPGAARDGPTLWVEARRLSLRRGGRDPRAGEGRPGGARGNQDLGLPDSLGPWLGRAPRGKWGLWAQLHTWPGARGAARGGPADPLAGAAGVPHAAPPLLSLGEGGGPAPDTLGEAAAPPRTGRDSGPPAPRPQGLTTVLWASSQVRSWVSCPPRPGDNP